MIKTQNKYKLSARAKSPRTFSPTLTLYKTVVRNIKKMLTNQEADYLLKLDKVLSNPSQTIDLSKKKNRIELISHQDSDYDFGLK